MQDPERLYALTAIQHCAGLIVSAAHQVGHRALAWLPADVVKAEKAAASRNAGIALARMAKHPGGLQQLKELQGLEILRCTVRP